MSSPLVVPAIKKHTATVVFMHGLGDTGYGWLPAARSLTKTNPTLQHIKWILPHAPSKPVTANHGLSMPAWFDIYNFSFTGSEDRKGMLESAGVLETLIQKEINESGLHPSRIVLGGFSQGGAMSLLTGLTAQSRLGGLVILSAWLPLRKELKGMLTPHAASLPVFWGHGADDLLIPHSIARRSVERLTQDFGFPSQNEFGSDSGLKLVTYPDLDHSTSEKELDDVAEFLKHVVPDTE
ncbi:Phospholipase/carboxylesterase/thioesterase [Scleroderma yunnanense]